MRSTKLTILIADDDPIIRLDLKQMLSTQGYEVIGEAGDGESALRLARTLKPDVCIFDVKMPHRDGIEAAAKIAEERAAPVILLTAYGDEELLSRARESGVYGYLVKPFKPADLPPAIEVARSRFEQTQALDKEVGKLQNSLETRKAIERAKGVLMTTLNINEPEAFRRIQQAAMSSRKSMKEIADSIVTAHKVVTGD